MFIFYQYRYVKRINSFIIIITSKISSYVRTFILHCEDITINISMQLIFNVTASCFSFPLTILRSFVYAFILDFKDKSHAPIYQ